MFIDQTLCSPLNHRLNAENGLIHTPDSVASAEEVALKGVTGGGARSRSLSSDADAAALPPPCDGTPFTLVSG